MNRRATILSADKNFGTGFTPSETFGSDTSYTITCEDIKNTDLFTCTVETVSQGVCQNILALGWKMPTIILPTTCSETNEMVFTFNKDLDGGMPCTEEMPCPNPNATCVSGACVEPEPKTCNLDTATDPNNPCGDECQVCNPNTNKCENACERKKYLQSSGTQYIDTEFIPNSNTQVDVKFCFTTVTFGASNAYLNGISGNKMVWGYAGSVSRDYIHVGISNKNEHIEECPVALDKDYHLIFDGSGYFSCNGGSHTVTVNPFTQTGSISLFARKNGSSNDAAFSGKIYYLKLRDNGNLVRDLIPVVSPAESRCGGKPAMYDKETKTLFCNQGSGEFSTN